MQFVHNPGSYHAQHISVLLGTCILDPIYQGYAQIDISSDIVPKLHLSQWKTYPHFNTGIHAWSLIWRSRITLDLGARQLPRLVDRTKLCLCSDWPYIAAEQLVLRQPLHARHLRFPACYDNNICQTGTWTSWVCHNMTHKSQQWPEPECVTMNQCQSCNMFTTSRQETGKTWASHSVQVVG